MKSNNFSPLFRTARAGAIAGILLGVVIAAGPAWAWGPEGHCIVGHIAEMRLSDAARSNITALLQPGERIPDDSVASWADEYRRKVSASGPWHYVDIPYGAHGYDPARDCPTGACVVAQIARWERTLASKGASHKKREQALRFLVHFVGDIHQPLHCISRDDDRGGNLRTIQFPGQDKPTNLHATWDINLVSAVINGRDVLQCAKALEKGITETSALSWEAGTAVDWAMESHAAAIEFAYAGVPPVGGPPFALDADYVGASKSVVQLRLQQAGVRLALLVNRALP